MEPQPLFMGEIIVTKPANYFQPMQEGFERCRLASERLTSAYSEIVAHEFSILENAFFESLGEMQGLSPVHGPVEFFEQGAILAWKNAERSLKAFNDLNTEISRFWFGAMKAASNEAPRPAKSRPVQ